MADRPERPSDEEIGRARFTADALLRELRKGDVRLLARVFRWADSERARLESELTARTAETDEQAAERELGAWLVAHPGWTWSQIRLHGDYEVCLRYGVEPVWGGWQSARAAAIRAALAKAGGGEGG